MRRQPVTVRSAGPDDAPAWERMRQRLWPSTDGSNEREISAYFMGDQHDPAEVFLAFDSEGRALGFAEASLRSHAEGCGPGPVTYLEGLFVEETARKKGVGAALVAAVEEWGRARGCAEIASDTEISNEVSQAVHHALGFEEADQIVCFRKDL